MSRQVFNQVLSRVVSNRKVCLGLLIGAAVLISGCGQKGPLYLPGQKDAHQHMQPAHSPVVSVTIQKIS